MYLEISLSVHVRSQCWFCTLYFTHILWSRQNIKISSKIYCLPPSPRSARMQACPIICLLSFQQNEGFITYLSTVIFFLPLPISVSALLNCGGFFLLKQMLNYSAPTFPSFAVKSFSHSPVTCHIEKIFWFLPCVWRDVAEEMLNKVFRLWLVSLSSQENLRLEKFKWTRGHHHEDEFALVL